MKPAPRGPHGVLTRLDADNESQLLRSAKPAPLPILSQKVTEDE